MHADPELIALLALGEDVGTEHERRHSHTCLECLAELSQLRQVVTLGRSVGAETVLVPPSQDVWARICAELAFVVDPPVVGQTSPASSVLEAPTVMAPVGAAPGADRHPELVARAQLAPVQAPWSDATGTAEVSTDDRGRRLLQVALRAELPTSGVRQAWLVHRDHPGLRQTLGILDGPHGLWTVEHSLDLEQYAILDISQQELGQTEHSGQIIVRGALTLVS